VERSQSQAEREAQAQLLQSILDSMGEGVAVVDALGQFVVFNRLGREIVGLGPVTGPPEEWPARYGLYLPDQVTPYPADDLPLVRAMRGEPVREVPMFVRNERRPEGLWLRVTATPLRDVQGRVCGGVAVFRDVTDVTRVQQALDAERRALHHMVQAQERDRRLTAYEIHDGFVQQVTAALLQLEASGLREAEEGRAGQCVRAAISLLGSAIEEARRLINGLRPPLLDELGLVAAVERLVASISDEGGLQVELEHEVAFDRLDPLLEGAVFRMVQEALNNARRHSGSQRLAVRLVQRQDRLLIEVIDWGRGFDPADVPAGRFGLRGLMERARIFGGSVRVESAPSQGTRLSIDLPLGAWQPPGLKEPSPQHEDRP
jgi:signal transduction histidine kinase